MSNLQLSNTEILKNLDELIKSNFFPPNFINIFSLDKIIIKDITDSTNNDAKKIASHENFGYGTVIFAKEQTAGRGRMGHSFYSPKESGLYMSLILSGENCKINGQINPAAITATAAVAVCNAVEKTCNISPKIKWVNDLFYKGKKICGILTEGNISSNSGEISQIILGIGINLRSFQQSLPEDIKNIAGSLECDQININLFAANIIFQIFSLTQNINENWLAILQEYKDKSLILGKFVNGKDANGYNEKLFVHDIDKDAALLVENDKGEKFTINSGEISIHTGDFYE